MCHSEDAGYTWPGEALKLHQVSKGTGRAVYRNSISVLLESNRQSQLSADESSPQFLRAEPFPNKENMTWTQQTALLPSGAVPAYDQPTHRKGIG